MNNERLYQVILGPHISEKANIVAEANNQVVFKVRTDANKLEIKKAVEKLLNVKVEAVNTVLVKGKTKRFGRTSGRRSDFKKAYITLPAGTEVQLADVAE
ncbi:MAG: 50S ribosomal protein L23 [Moraxellaceae bacterium]|nr:50S ribosomal protein L23 [Pseudomonadales bacterium]MCB1674610.1 50S ribosomal protein L23 [Pseudomonadales bacterium]MCP5174657.1 50S ribosomal protein L23 [Moraxellaceae bacterium]MCP5177439.1 50S ribosomal protein L23 [Moraxellaceae bacterium]HQV21538.1 50S ribosomal protein L23 [Agitococcus sp.]